MPASPSSNRFPVIIGVIAMVIAGIVTYDNVVKPNIFPKRFHVVEAERVYRSGALTPAALANVVEANGIRTIVDLGGFHDGSGGDDLEQRTAETMGVTRYRFKLQGDATGNANHYLNTLRIMTDPENQPVLVHCAAGTERTGAAIVFYRHIVDGLTLDDALGEAEDIGYSPRSNPHLREVVERWAAPLTEAYEHGGPLEGETPVPPPTPVRSDH